jgi:hypothetical protein
MEVIAEALEVGLPNISREAEEFCALAVPLGGLFLALNVIIG